MGCKFEIKVIITGFFHTTEWDGLRGTRRHLVQLKDHVNGIDNERRERSDEERILLIYTLLEIRNPFLVGGR